MLLVAESTRELHRRYKKGHGMIDFFAPEEYQRDFLNSTSDFVIAQGSNRSGKSECGAIRFIKIASHEHSLNKQRDWHGPIFLRAVSESLGMAYDILVGKFRQFMPWSKLKHPSFEKSFNRRDSKLYLKNKGYIQFLSNDQDVEKHAGAALHGVWADEQPKQEILSENLARLADFNGITQVTLTPDKGITFLQRDYLSRAVLGSGIEYYFFDMLKNPYIDRVSFVKKFANETQRTIDTKIFGKAIDMEGLVYPEFDPNIHVIDSFLPDESFQMFIGLDFGIRNPSAATFWAVNSKNEIYQVDEIYVTDTTIEQFGKLVHDKVSSIYKKLRFRYCRYDPNSGAQRGLQTKETNAKSFRKGLGFGPIIPGERGPGSVDHRINCMHMLLLANKETKWSKFKITRNCIHTIREFGLYSYKRDTEKKNRSETPVSKDDHAMNANEYLAEKLPKFRVVQEAEHRLSSQYSRGGII